ncbi:25-hydroxycholesterol 7-alpha-hydroxylase [Colletotrichum fructicola]|nr:25-hydroxycholesterol 7-alpha-hydroxylase [Colletotrichum fructicola]
MALITLLGVVLTIFAGAYALDLFVFFSRDSREPQYVRSRVPLIGHLIGISKRGAGWYYTDVASSQPSGIFTLPIFTFKLYVISERKLISAIQRHAKTISFTPFAAKTSKTLSGLGDIVLRIQDHLQGPPEAKEFDRVQRASMSAGPDLDAMTLVSSKVTLELVEELATEANAEPGTRIELYTWLKHLIALSASEGMFGPMNPFRDPEHEADFWTFAEKSHILVMGGLMPQILARDALQARERNAVRYENYIRNGGHEEASGVVKGRCRVLKENGATVRDMGRIHIGFDMAMLANYAPTAFWAVYEILSRPRLVQEIRDEVRKAITKGDEADWALDISILKTACPLLLSSIQEAQRVNSVQAGIREILRDTTITTEDSSVLLKKASYLQINGISTLRNLETWGSDAADFDPYRFIKMKRPGTATPVVAAASELPPNAFSVWGVAPHVCPARWYATGGIMVLVAMLVLRFDFDVEGDLQIPGRNEVLWRKPKAAKDFSTLPAPGEPEPVLLRARKELAGRWDVKIGTPSTRLQLSVP